MQKKKLLPNKIYTDIGGHRFVGREERTHNSRFAIGGVSCSADSFTVTESSVLRINICGKNPAHRKSAKRYASPYDDRQC